MNATLTVESAAVDLRQPHVRAAAIAALSWARARRDTWHLQHDAPDNQAIAPSLSAAALAATPEASAAIFVPTLEALSAPVFVPTLEGEEPPPDSPATPTVVWSLTGLRMPVPTAAALRVALLVALAGAAVATRGYWLKPWPIPTLASVSAKAPTTRTPEPVVARKPTAVVEGAVKRVGALQMTSDPAGAAVFVDGHEQGVTPLTLDGIRSGSHEVVLKRGDLSIRRVVTVRAHETARVSEMLFAGWVTVFSPFDITITEGDQTIRLDDRHSAMLSPGPHDLRFANRSLAFEEVRRVDVRPGAFISLSLVPPPSTLNVRSTTPVEVWIDGIHIGQTPLTAIPVELGTRGIVVRGADGVERQMTVTVTTKPVDLDVTPAGR